MDTAGLLRLIYDCGAASAAPIDASGLVLRREFRDLCEKNACGSYGRCWVCPPHIGPIDECMAHVRTCGGGVLYQSVAPLEDSFDFEGMMAAAAAHAQLSQRIENALNGRGRFLHLTAGGCHLCRRCTAPDGEPCRRPGRALSSLEGFGIDVYSAAKDCGLSYINGANTVTYFGLVLTEGSEHGPAYDTRRRDAADTDL